MRGFSREKSASCASYCISRVFVPKTLSNLLSAIFLEETYIRSAVVEIAATRSYIADDLNL